MYLHHVAGKFGSLVVYLCNHQIKICHTSLTQYMYNHQIYNTAIVIWDPTAKFNSCQYLQLYSTLECDMCILRHVKDWDTHAMHNTLN